MALDVDLQSRALFAFDQLFNRFGSTTKNINTVTLILRNDYIIKNLHMVDVTSFFTKSITVCLWKIFEQKKTFAAKD